MRRATQLLPRSIPQTTCTPVSFKGTFRSRASPQLSIGCTAPSCLRTFSSANIWRKEKTYTDKAKELTRKGIDKEEDWFNNQLDDAIGDHKEIQARTPWHRGGSDKPPVKRNRSAGAMTKGFVV